MFKNQIVDDVAVDDVVVVDVRVGARRFVAVIVGVSVAYEEAVREHATESRVLR